MLKTTRLSDLALREPGANEVVEGGGKADDRNLSKSKKSKNANSEMQTHIGAMGEPIFLTLGAKEVFNHLRQVFTKALILRHFELECHIRIETDALGYAIGRILSQLTSNNLTSDHLTSNQGQWQLVVYFLRKTILAEIRYKTHNSELLDLIQDFKTWRHYLEGYKHEAYILTNYNNLWRFMDTKNLSFCQVWWVQELFRYHFRIDYCQGKINGTTDAFSRFPQRSQAEKDKLQAENTQTLQKLKSSLTNTSLSSLCKLSSLKI